MKSARTIRLWVKGPVALCMCLFKRKQVGAEGGGFAYPRARLNEAPPLGPPMRALRLKAEIAEIS